MADEDNLDEALQELDGQDLDEQGDASLEQGDKAKDQSDGAPPKQQVGRAEGRIARLARELKETKERDLRREQEFNALRAQLQQATQPRGETQEQRQARLDQMTTEERMMFLWNESETRNNQQRQYDQFLNNDRADQQAFQARMAHDKRAEKYKDEVEQTLQATRKQMGVNPSREAVYAYVLGMKIINAKGKATQGQTTGVARRQAAQRTTPATTGGDVGRGRRAQSLEEKIGADTLI